MNITEICAAIIAMDEADLTMVRSAVKGRQAILATINKQVALVSFKDGDKVSLFGLAPKYVNGATGVVSGRKGDRFMVKLDENWFNTRARQRFGSSVAVPAVNIKAVAA